MHMLTRVLKPSPFLLHRIHLLTWCPNPLSSLSQTHVHKYTCIHPHTHTCAALHTHTHVNLYTPTALHTHTPCMHTHTHPVYTHTPAAMQSPPPPTPCIPTPAALHTNTLEWEPPAALNYEMTMPFSWGQQPVLPGFKNEEGGGTVVQLYCLRAEKCAFWLVWAGKFIYPWNAHMKSMGVDMPTIHEQAYLLKHLHRKTHGS